MKSFKQKLQGIDFNDFIDLLLFGSTALFITTISIGMLVCIISGEGRLYEPNPNCTGNVNIQPL